MDEKVVAKADAWGERLGGIARTHKALAPAAIGLVAGWALGRFGPDWVNFVVWGLVVLIACFVVWAEHHQVKEQRNGKAENQKPGP